MADRCYACGKDATTSAKYPHFTAYICEADCVDKLHAMIAGLHKEVSLSLAGKKSEKKAKRDVKKTPRPEQSATERRERHGKRIREKLENLIAPILAKEKGFEWTRMKLRDLLLLRAEPGDQPLALQIAYQITRAYYVDNEETPTHKGNAPLEEVMRSKAFLRLIKHRADAKARKDEEYNARKTESRRLKKVRELLERTESRVKELPPSQADVSELLEETHKALEVFEEIAEGKSNLHTLVERITTIVENVIHRLNPTFDIEKDKPSFLFYTTVPYFREEDEKIEIKEGIAEIMAIIEDSTIDLPDDLKRDLFLFATEIIYLDRGMSYELMTGKKERFMKHVEKKLKTYGYDEYA